MAKKSTTGVMTRLLLIYLVVTVLYTLLRNPIGEAMNYVLGGLVTNLHVPLFITILLLSVITGAYSSLLLNRFVDQEKVKESQAVMKDFQKEYREAQIAGDKGKLKKLEPRREEVMALSMDVQSQTMKPMPYILVISLPIFGWMSYIMYSSTLSSYVATTINMPYFGQLAYTQGVILGMPVWLIWYLLCSLVFTQVIRKTLGM
ncbi:MAG: EMC3/TMCO1 family protein [Euryarchaeota archaeon]|nr:EMC3/TMCO1 family protein [Euryarchaeota archaeon]